MKCVLFCAVLTVVAMVHMRAFAADAPKRSSVQRVAAEHALAEREAAAARADAERQRAESAEISKLEARGAPRSVVLERKLRATPEDSAERLRVAEAYLLEAQDSPSKLDAAQAHVDRVLQGKPTDVSALMLAGRIAMLKGQPAVAQARYQAATAADPNNAAAFLALGQTWSRLGNDANASAAYSEYRRLSGMAPLPAPGSETVSPTVPRQPPPIIIGPGKDPKQRSPRR